MAASKRERITLEGSVVLIGAHFECPNCKNIKPASKFGFRKLSGKTVNQSYCKDCR